MDEHTDRDMTKLIVAFRNFANAPKFHRISIYEESWRISIKQTVKQIAVCAGQQQTSIRYIVQFPDKAL